MFANRFVFDFSQTVKMSLIRRDVVDRADYAHLTEKERMMAGYPYCTGDEQLTRERATARKLVREFNAIGEYDTAAQRVVLEQLLHPQCRGRKFLIEKTFRVDYGYNVIFGENFYVNFDCVILDSAPITFGENCMIAPGVHIYTATHPLNAQHRQDNELAYPIKIGNDVWIGGKATICPGVIIGDNSVIGAGSVVVKDVPANTVVAGNPAKVIRHIDTEAN